MESDVKRAGRKRDNDIDARILHAARRQLACRGYEGMSLASVAEEACTTRQALYRRWPSKQMLAADAIAYANRPAVADLCISNDPRGDLERELVDFQQTMSKAEHRSLAGTMLQDGTDASTRDEYAAHVINPRLNRLRVILEHAKGIGLIDEEADIELAIMLPTGAWYERQLAGMPVPDDWAPRTATLIWRAVGG